jgi:DNA (cytosine-5)-methyltransferase 1
VKSKRAQSNDDNETWVEGGVVPTMNAFDQGDSRATVIIFEATRVDDVRIYEDKSPTVATYWGTGGSRVPYVFPIQGSQIGRDDKNGPQGSGFGEEDGPMFTVNTTDKHAVAVYPIQDGRDMNHQQNGLGISEEGEPSYTLLQTQHASVAFYSTDGGFGAKNDDLAPSTKVGGVTAMANNSVVRRLTPTECERLQGFPDGWTENQADSHRYKQMGNAVAVPVVEWIMERLVHFDEMV